RGPRKMAVVIRAIVNDDAADSSAACEVSLVSKYRTCVANNRDQAEKAMTDATGSIVVLENKTPKWSVNRMAYMLDFGGRVTMASSKNFQLICLDCDHYVAVQFGKTDRDAFTLDFRFPVSPVMAFGIAVSVIVRSKNSTGLFLI
ncbi:hypothetical protein EV179_006197, partial [Coemansia sp. RSA 487]